MKPGWTDIFKTEEGRARFAKATQEWLNRPLLPRTPMLPKIFADPERRAVFNRAVAQTYAPKNPPV
jgi:hypothetical protein